MSGYVVDERVAVKWLVSEAFSDEAARLIDGKASLSRPSSSSPGRPTPSEPCAAAATLRAPISALQPRPANSHELYSNRRCIIIAAEPVRLG